MTKSYRDSEFKIDLEIDNAHTRIVELVGQGKKVLEVGCATGYMSRVLVERNSCEVVGIELDTKAAEQAREICTQVIIGDLELLDFDQELQGRRFDVIVCADVLEHLRNPKSVLRRLRKFLDEDGLLVASIPNIAHISVIAELIEGRFSYSSEGLLDESHLRFFTLDTIYETLEASGFAITHLDRIKLEPEETEFRTDLTALPKDLIERLRSAPESATYQFILSARSSTDKNNTLERSIPRVRGKGETHLASQTRPALSQADPWHSLVQALFGRLHHLEESRRRLSLQQGALNERLAGLQQHVRKLTELSHQREASIAQLESEARTKDASIANLEVEIERRSAAVANLEAEANKGRSTIAHLEGEIERRNASLANLEAETDKSRATIAHLEGEIERRDTDISNLETELEKTNISETKLEKEIAQQDASIARLSEDLSKKEACIASLKNEITRQNESLTSLTDEHHKLHTSFAAARNHVHQLEQDLTSTNDRLSRVFSSRSWKVASKIRRVFVRVCPPGSRRDRYFRAIIGGANREGRDENPS
jgi:2-polyprenyl-3-methyl-5-hydroxy-6-metoxy-1,4-benzoquinol methylase/peptidoglycan hydrolase CwlO-like protein